MPKIERLKYAVDNAILVDNTEEGTGWLTEKLFKSSNITCFQPRQNLGVAVAQNMGIKYVYERFSDEDKVIFFDQDSFVPIDLPLLLARAHDKLNITRQVAAVEPNFIDQSKGFTYPQVAWSKLGVFKRFMPNVKHNEQKAAMLISSGMLTDVKTLKQVGEYDESLFIDYVDTDWCLKAQVKGFELYVMPNIKMIHSIGVKSLKLLGHNLTVHPPLRRYYMMRNSLFMAKKEYVDSALATMFMFRTVLHHLLLILCDNHKGLNAKAFIKGLLDGSSNKIENNQLLSKRFKIKQKL
ncbi:hypothetical protein [Marinomonas sp. GJ51-6]|uniref:hypothetical protein n=1 Tax=Marinomonas sp. GJ51-6 TaxID=2992802 RepID=UPI0039775A7B